MGRLKPFVVLVLFLAGCSSTAPRITTLGSVSISEIRGRVNANLERIKTLRGTGTISVESTEMSGSGSFEISLRKPDSVLLRFEGPFGIEVGSALVTRTEFSFYSSFQNQLVTGATSSANMSRYLRMNVTFDDLLNLFAGSALFMDDNDTDGTLTTEENQYVVQYKQADRSRRYWIDPGSLLITKIQNLDVRGVLTSELRLSNFRVVGDAHFPSDIRLVMNAERRILSIHYSSTTINATPLNFTLRVPENAQRIRIQ